MPWQELTFQTDATHADALSGIFTEFGAVAVTFLDAQDQPIYEPAPGTQPLWKLVKISALFEEHDDLTAIQEFCHSHPLIQDADIKLIADRDWERVWMDEFKPMRFGNRLWICPSWCEPPDPTAVNIHLDPGLAFGTGTHATTAMCLEALDALDLTDKTVLDYGCGSGILAVAAMKLGACCIWAVDNDPQALIATTDNANKNNIDLANFHIEHSNNFKPTPSDVVVANILANPLVALSEKLSNACKQHLILSGILPEQAGMVKQAYQPYFNFMPDKQHNGWVCLIGIKKAQNDSRGV